jgi:signal transduction histidine kinase
VLKKSIDTARPTADAKQIALRLEGDAGVPLISVDPARLQQIVWNLLTNAIKFTPKGGTIRVEVRRVQSELRIVVTDTGQGNLARIPAASIQPVQPGGRFNHTIARRFGIGVGIGPAVG